MKLFYQFGEFNSIIENEFNLSLSELPFVFTQGYNNFLSKQGYDVKYYFFEGSFTLIGLKKSKLILTAYLIFPPLKGDCRLSEDAEMIFYSRITEDIKVTLSPDQISPHVPIEVSRGVPKTSKFAVFGNVSVQLKDRSPESIFSAFQSSNRNIIRKAIQEEAYVKFGDDCFDDFYELYADTHKRQKLYFDSKEDLHQLYQSIKNNCLCAVVYTKANIPEGAIFVPYSKFAGYSYVAGSAERPSIRGAIKLLHWEVIQELKRKEVDRFVLGGARINDDSTPKQKGMKDFKMSFGSSLEEGYLWKVNYSPLKNKIYQNGVKFKLKLKGVKFLPDIIDQINTTKP